jgi:hypothetical protein
VGRHQINLDPDKPANRIKVPAQSVEELVSKRKRARKCAFNVEPGRIIVLVERPGEKVLRKNLRISEFYDTHRHGRQILLVTSHELPRVVRLLGLGPDQVIPVSTRSPRGSGGSSTKGVNAAPDSLAKGKFWMEKTGAKSLHQNIAGIHVNTTDDLFLKSTRVGYYDSSPIGIGPLLYELGFKEDDVEFFTEKQAKDKGLTGRRMLNDELIKRAVAHATKTDLQARYEGYANHQKYMELTKYGMVSDEVSRVIGTTRYGKREIFEVASRIATLAVESLIPAESNLSEVDMMIIRLLGLSVDPSKITLTKAQISAKIEEAVSPLQSLVNEDDPIVYLIETYIANNKEDASE